jgi:S1-C subfamily serine protease
MRPSLKNQQALRRGFTRLIITGILPLVLLSLILCSCGNPGAADSLVRVYADDVAAAGIFVDKAGYVVTGAKAVSGADSISLEPKPGTSFAGRVICVDSARDLAVIKMEGNYPALKPSL